MHMSGLSNLEPDGLVHLYEGGGKGKTTAATGLAVRALGRGKAVLFCQFLKGRDSGELISLGKLGAVIVRAKCGGKFIYQMDETEREQLRRNHAACFAQVCRECMEGGFDLVVLDEIVDAVNLGLVPVDGLLALIKNRPAHVELVLTGHDAPDEIRNAADYHTDFVCKRHPFERGVAARGGIEY